MKSILTAAALALLTATGAQAANIPAADAGQVREIKLNNGQDIRDAGSSSVSATVGAPTELPVAVLPPRDRVEAGYKADSVVLGSTFGGTPAVNVGAR